MGALVVAHNGFLSRAGVLADLQQKPGMHVVLVRYGARTSPLRNLPRTIGKELIDWVYNGADIDAARVVWAQDMGTLQNQPLVEYYKDRQFWLLEADAKPPRLSPYVSAPGSTALQIESLRPE